MTCRWSVWLRAVAARGSGPAPAAQPARRPRASPLVPGHPVVHSVLHCSSSTDARAESTPQSGTRGPTGTRRPRLEHGVDNGPRPGRRRPEARHQPPGRQASAPPPPIRRTRFIQRQVRAVVPRRAHGGGRRYSTSRPRRRGGLMRHGLHDALRVAGAGLVAPIRWEPQDPTTCWRGAGISGTPRALRPDPRCAVGGCAVCAESARVVAPREWLGEMCALLPAVTERSCCGWPAGSSRGTGGLGRGTASASPSLWCDHHHHAVRGLGRSGRKAANRVAPFPGGVCPQSWGDLHSGEPAEPGRAPGAADGQELGQRDVRRRTGAAEQLASGGLPPRPRGAAAGRALGSAGRLSHPGCVLPRGVYSYSGLRR